MQERETWSSQFSFILAGVGAAIGVGNLWLFPWRISTYGGGSFLIPYLFFIFVFVRLGLAAEFAFGRSQQKGPAAAFKAVFPKKYKVLATALGTLPGIALFGILSFYIVVAGWIASYTFLFLKNYDIITKDPVTYFNSYAGSTETFAGLIIVTLIITITIILGVTKGIEKCNAIAMPLFFVTLIILLITSLTLKGASDAFYYMFTFSWDKLLCFNTWVMALGQSFFTVSLGGMLTYGSYLKKDSDIPKASFWTVFFNTMASILATLVIMPAIFSFKMDLNSGPALLFITIPEICTQIPYGIIFGGLFFFCALLAALSSAINLFEVPAETLMSIFKIERKQAAIITLILMLIASIPLSLNMKFFGNWTDFVTIYFYPIIPLVIQGTFFWIYGKDNAVKAINEGSKHPFSKFDTFMLKYIFTSICIIVIILSILYKGIG